MADVIVPLLRQMLSPDTAALAAAEHALRELEGMTVDFAVHLLEVIGTYPTSAGDRAEVCQAAAIVLKQVVKRRWPIGPEGIPHEVKVRVLAALAPVMLHVDSEVVARQLSECFWPVLGDPSLAEDAIGDVLTRLEDAWAAGSGSLTAVCALLRVFKVAIRMLRLQSSYDDDLDAGGAVVAPARGAVADIRRGLAKTVESGIGLLFRMLARAVDQGEHVLAKHILQVLLIAAEHRASVDTVFAFWGDLSCVDTIVSIISAPVDPAAGQMVAAAQWKGKARAVLTWMHVAIARSSRECPADLAAALDDKYVSVLDAAFGLMDARGGVPSGDEPDEIAFSDFVRAVCQCVSMSALDTPALASNFFAPARVEHLLTQTLLRLLCVGEHDHDLLTADPTEYHRRTEEEFNLVMMDSLLLVCPHGEEFAHDCGLCEELRYEMFDDKSTARAAAMSAIESMARMEGCCEPYIEYVSTTLASTPGVDPDSVSLRCGLFKAFAAAAQSASSSDNEGLKARVSEVLGKYVLTELQGASEHPLAVHTRCACCAVAERYMSFLFAEGHVDLVLTLVETMIHLVAHEDECVRVHAIEAIRSTVRTHALLQPLFQRHAPAILGAVCGLLDAAEPVAEATADVLQLVTLCVFKFFGRLGDDVAHGSGDADGAAGGSSSEVRKAHIAASHNRLLLALSQRFDAVIHALAEGHERHGDINLEMLLCRHIEAAHAVCMSAPVAPPGSNSSQTVHPELQETLLVLTTRMLSPEVVHVAAKFHVIADMIDCVVLLPAEAVSVQDSLIEPLMRLVGLNMSGRELCVHPLCVMLHHAGPRVLEGPLAGPLAMTVEQSLLSTSPVLLCHLADLVRSIAIASRGTDETRELRQHLVSMLVQQLLRVVSIEPTTMPEAQIPVRITSALCAMLYADPEATWVTLTSAVDAGGGEAVTGVGLLCHFGMSSGFPRLSSKRLLDVAIILLGLGRAVMIEAEKGAAPQELWSACFVLLAKYNSGEDDDSGNDDESDDNFHYDPDEAIADEESCEIVEAELFEAMPELPQTRLREAALLVCSQSPDAQAQLMQMAGEEAWSLLMAPPVE